MTYDFNSQWNGDWQTYHVQTSGPGASPSMNYSKMSEGRTGGAGGNRLGGTVTANNGYQGSITSVYAGYGAVDLSNQGNRIRLQGSYSAFANQSAFTGGTNDVGQVGLLAAPTSFGNNAASTLKLGDSLYLGFVERNWTGQSVGPPPAPGSADVELVLFKDGARQRSFGTFNIADYGARIGNEVYAQWFEYDLLFEKSATGSIAYKIGVNTVSFYDDNLFSAPDPVEGASVSLGVWEGSVTGNGGFADSSDLRIAYGTHIGDTKVTITGYTFDHLPGGDIHDGIISIPEPSVGLLALLSVGLLARRRRQA